MKSATRLIVLLCAALLLGAGPRPSHATPGRATGVVADSQAPITAASALGGRFKDTYVDGTRAYLIEGAGLTVLDISNPAAPLVRSHTPLPGTAERLAAANGFVYLLGLSLPVLWVYDARDPAAPILVRQQSFGEGFYAYRMWLAGGALWLGDMNELRRFELRDPAAPALTSVLPCNTSDLQVSGTLVYLLDLSAGVQIWDLSDPRTPHQRGQVVPLPMDAGSAYTGLALSGDKLYVAATRPATGGGEKHFVVTLDVSEPSRPGVLATGPAKAEGLDLVAGHLVTLLSGELRVYNMGDLVKPTVVYTQTLGADSYQIVSDTLYTQAFNTWRAIDLSSPSAPVLRGQYQVRYTLTSIPDVTPVGQRLYAHLSEELQIIDASAPLTPTLQARIPLRSIQPPDIDGTRLLVPGDGLRLVDASDPLSPTVRAVVPQGLMGQIEGDLAYVITATGLEILDISGFANPTPLGSVAFSTTTEHPYQMLVAGGRVYVGRIYAQGCQPGCFQTRLDLQVVDVSNPRQPRAAGRLSGLEVDPSLMNWALSGTTLFIAANKLHIVDASNIDAPALSDYRLGGTANAIQIAGGRAYVAGSAGLTTLDLADPLHPTTLGSFSFGPLGATRVQIIGERAYVLSQGLRVLDIRNPSNPLPLAMYGSYAENLAVADGYAYLAMGQGGLQIVQIHPERFVKPLLLPLVRRG